MISLAARSVPYRPRLAAPPSDGFQGTLVTVIDRQGKPVAGADVRVFERNQVVAQAKTDTKGDALLAVWMGPYDISVTYGGHTLWKEASAKEVARGETIIVELPFCIRDPILKPIDMILLASAGALAAAGMYWKVQPLTMAGEVVFGATAFSIIYRLSCL